MLVLRWLGTTVVAPLAALVIEAIEDVRGLVTPDVDDVPAAVECDVRRVRRDGASEGGLEVIRGLRKERTGRGRCVQRCPTSFGRRARCGGRTRLNC